MIYNLSVNTNEMKYLANLVEAYMQNYDTAYKKIYSLVESIGTAWQGSDNLAYIQSISEFKKDFEQIDEIISQYVCFIRYAYKQFTDAQANLALAAQ